MSKAAKQTEHSIADTDEALSGEGARSGFSGISDGDAFQFEDELPEGATLMHGQYTIEKFINAGGFGITYSARDSLDRRVVIKECFPGTFCRRSRALVNARSRAHQNELNSIVRLFVQEARSLSKLVHPNIVGVHQVFEENNTAYMALDFVQGRDLLEVIEDGTVTLAPNVVESILRKVLDAITFIHDQGILHRDISPDNILVNEDFEPILIDFGAAREQATKQSRVLSALRVVKDGYSPQEFYIAGSEQGPSSDLYALAATFYHLITGELPPSSQVRLAEIAAGNTDPFEATTGRVTGYSKPFLAALDKAIQVLPKDRIATARDWIDMLDGKAVVTPASGSKSKAVKSRDKGDQKSSKVMPILLGTVAAGVVAAVGAVQFDLVDLSGDATSTTPALAIVAPQEDVSAISAELEKISEKQTFADATADTKVPSADVAPNAAEAVLSKRVEPVVKEPVLLAEPNASTVKDSAAAPSVNSSQPAETKQVDQQAEPSPAVASIGEVSEVEPDTKPDPLANSPTPEIRVTEVANVGTSAKVLQQASAVDARFSEPLDETVVTFSGSVPSSSISGTNLQDARIDTAAQRAATVPSVNTGSQFIGQDDYSLVPNASGLSTDTESSVDVASRAKVSNTSLGFIRPVLRDERALRSSPSAPAELTLSALPSIGFESVPAPQPKPLPAKVVVDEVFDVEGMLSRWTVDLPQNLTNFKAGAPERILSVNGQSVASRYDFDQVLNTTLAPSQSGRVDFAVAIAQAGGQVREEVLSLPVIQRTLLTNGVSFETVADGDAWITTISKVPSSITMDLKEGDVVFGHLATSTVLNQRLSLPRLVALKIGKGQSVLDLAIKRGGETWVVAVPVTSNPSQSVEISQ
ncbi:MAG: protein kinase [Pseudomonadota bacterium]